MTSYHLYEDVFVYVYTHKLTKAYLQYFAASLMKRWHLFPLPSIWADFVTNFDQQHAAEFQA